jgi:pSer/pThr/pTyr-binding forkhead associated (FHA) protein
VSLDKQGIEAGWAIKGLNGEHEGRTFAVEDVLTIGSAEDNQVIISTAMVSRYHAVIRYVGARLTVFDIDSLNGTYVNDCKVESKGLGYGDILKLDTEEFLVFKQAASDAPNKTQFRSLKELQSEEPQAEPAQALKEPVVPAPEPEPAVEREEILTVINPPADSPAVREEPVAPPANSDKTVVTMGHQLESDQTVVTMGHQLEPDSVEPAAVTLECSATENTLVTDSAIEPIPEPVKPAPKPEQQMLFLQGLSDPVNGKRFPLNKPQLTIGRSPFCDVIVSSSSVSQEHVELQNDDGVWYLRDLGSSNGTLVNGDLLEEGELRLGDKLTLGAVEFELYDPLSSKTAEATTAKGPLKSWKFWVGLSALIILDLVITYRYFLD